VNNELNPVIIKYGQNIIINMKIRFTEDIDDVHFGFALVSRDGLYIHGSNTELQNIMPRHWEAGEIANINFSIQSLLVGGDYFINLGVFRNNSGDAHEYLDARRSVIHIKVTDTPWCKGILSFLPNIKISEYR
jgi:hypothetical protein